MIREEKSYCFQLFRLPKVDLNVLNLFKKEKKKKEKEKKAQTNNNNHKKNHMYKDQDQSFKSSQRDLLITLRSDLLVNNTYKTQKHNSTVPIKIWPSCLEPVNILGSQIIGTKLVRFPREGFPLK